MGKQAGMHRVALSCLRSNGVANPRINDQTTTRSELASLELATPTYDNEEIMERNIISAIIGAKYTKKCLFRTIGRF